MANRKGKHKPKKLREYNNAKRLNHIILMSGNYLSSQNGGDREIIENYITAMTDLLSKPNDESGVLIALREEINKGGEIIGKVFSHNAEFSNERNKNYVILRTCLYMQEQGYSMEVITDYARTMYSWLKALENKDIEFATIAEITNRECGDKVYVSQKELKNNE